MLRKVRLDKAGALHHILVRCINKSAIFALHQKGNVLDFLGSGLGDSAFVKNLLVETKSDGRQQLKVNRTKKRISDIIAEHCAQTGINGTFMRSGSRRIIINRARAILRKNAPMNWV